MSYSEYRPMATLGIAYTFVTAVTVALTRFDGGLASIWLSTALLLARLVTLPPSKWWPSLTVCATATIVITGVLGLGWAAAVPMAAINMGEAVLGALLLRRLHFAGFDSLAEIVVFTVIAGVVAPAATAGFGAGVATWATTTGFTSNLIHWYIAHATGAIACTPLVLVLQQAKWHRIALATVIEAVVMIALTAGVAIAVFAQSNLPLLFLPSLPLVVMAFRFGKTGAAVAVAILGLIGGVLTLHGTGPIHLITMPDLARTLFFQFYLAIQALITLPIAAEMGKRRKLFAALTASESRYRLLADKSGDIVMDLTPSGRINYVSASIAEAGGYDPAALRGTQSLDLIVPDDRDSVAAAYARTLADPDATVTVEYQGLRRDGSSRWYESSTRGIVGPDGRVIAVVSATRDIARRKAVETALAIAANTDALTGIANRRAFIEALDARVADAEAGGYGWCVLFDLDGFKGVNDVHGHDAGDRVLQAFADIAVALPGAVVGRLGGDEFAAILWDADRATAINWCNRLRTMIASTQVTVRNDVTVGITISGGLAPIDGVASHVLAAADAALYRAKALGRNRVSIVEPHLVLATG